MNPVEVMTSESQERMLAIVRPDDLDEVLALCARWEIRASVVGRVTDTGRFRVYDGLFDRTGGPADRAARRRARRQPRRRPASTTGRLHRPADHDARNAADPAPTSCSRASPTGADLGAELLALLATPTIADKSWVWRQYDHQLFLNTVVGPGGDATRAAPEGHRRARSRSPPTARAGSAGSTRAPAAARRARGGAQRRVRAAPRRARS